MEELNYRPNAVARSLRSKKTQNIGVIVPDIAYPFLAEVTRGIEDAGFEQGYSVIVCESNSDLERETTCIDLLQAKQADGIIFVAAGESPQHIQHLIDQGTPVVICAREVPGVEVDTVVADDVGSGYQATDHLIQRDHRRIGCIAGPPALFIGARRVEGHWRALQEYSLPLDGALIVRGDFRCRGGYDAMQELLSLDPPPTAVFACNDLTAMGAICAASQRRLRIPDDVAIVGCDDIALAAFTNPSLTTVAQPKHDMGAAALEMLLDRIADPDRPTMRRILPTELLIRDSVGAGRLPDHEDHVPARPVHALGGEKL
jgi:LacI family transcriptional regulator